MEQQQEPVEEQNKSQAEEVIKKSRFGITVTIILVILIILAALGIVGWQYYLAQTKYQQLQTKFSMLQHTLQQSHSKIDWVMPEVHYLLRRAAVNLTVERNRQKTVAFLNLAKKRLTGLPATTQIIGLQKAIVADIAAVTTAYQPDVVELLVQIEAVGAQIAKLPTVATKLLVTDIQAVPENNSISSKTLWGKFWDSTVAKLRNVIIIQRNPEQIKPLQPLVNRLYCKEKVQLLLLQSKWAVLQQQSKIYKTTLQQATVLMNSCFAHNLTATTAIGGVLTKLMDTKIVPVFPSTLISETVIASFTS